MDQSSCELWSEIKKSFQINLNVLKENPTKWWFNISQRLFLRRIRRTSGWNQRPEDLARISWSDLRKEKSVSCWPVLCLFALRPRQWHHFNELLKSLNCCLYSKWCNGVTNGPRDRRDIHLWRVLRPRKKRRVGQCNSEKENDVRVQTLINTIPVRIIHQIRRIWFLPSQRDLGGIWGRCLHSESLGITSECV